MTFLNRVLQIADPRGRCNRKALLTIAVALLATQSVTCLIHATIENMAAQIAATAVELACIWVATSAAIKRLHDMGQSGWWVPGFFLALLVWTLLVSFGSFLAFGDAVTSIGSTEFMIHTAIVTALPFAVTIWLHFASGDKGPNRYGPEPDETGISAPVQKTNMGSAEPQLA
ncbi:MAG: DUF805 domain-containing protein [Alphaproteobacteria bacterium]|nr:DUF805 domain-containing protein [Alphaproteobacteria bacterium]